MTSYRRPELGRRASLLGLSTLFAAGGAGLPQPAAAQSAAELPSWNEGPAKAAILAFVRAATDPSNPKFVKPEDRIATFDQDGTLWVSHPMYAQVMYCLDRVPALVEKRPELRNVEPFRTVLSGDRAAIGRLGMPALEKILAATLTGMSIHTFQAEVRAWLATARHDRWKRPYTDLVYQPMLEVLALFRTQGFKTYIVTGGGQDFVRIYAQQVYGIPPEQVIGSVGGVRYALDRAGHPVLTKEPKLLLNDDHAGKPEGIHLMIGKRPVAAFGNSGGDREMLEYATLSPGGGLGVLLLHDDATREYAYGPAQGLPDTKIGSFSQGLYDQARKRGWTVVSMKTDWRRVFPFDV